MAESEEAHDNAALELDDEGCSTRSTAELSLSVTGKRVSNADQPTVVDDVDATVNQSSFTIEDESALTKQSPVVIGGENGRARLQSPTLHPRHIDGPVELLSVTELRDVNTARYGEADAGMQMALEEFVSKKNGPERKQYKSKKVRLYYKKQDELIEAFERYSRADAFDQSDSGVMKTAVRLAQITFAANLVLLMAKLAASILSASMSIISSLVDSVVDLLSGLLLWWAAHAMKKRDPYDYPQGRSKLEPLVIVILSVVMGLASVQLIRESSQKIATLVSDHTALPDMGLVTFLIAGSTVVIKFILWLVCRRVDTPTTQALAVDHRNDVLSNTVAIACGYLGSSNFQDVTTGLTGFIYTDPIGAILISCYIIYNWWITGSEQVRNLTGHTAGQDFLSHLTWISLHHDPRVTHIDTVRAYHYGNNYLVKVDIVLPEDMCLREAHDIGESLQQKLESIPEVERAFVHVDYEFEHLPSSEHKII